jgi:ankyrin repeat protein
MTPLICAAAKGATAAVASLIKLRANLDAQNSFG